MLVLCCTDVCYSAKYAWFIVMLRLLQCFLLHQPVGFIVYYVTAALVLCYTDACYSAKYAWFIVMLLVMSAGRVYR